MPRATRACPGCGIEMPRSELHYDRKFALADSPESHARIVRDWAAQVWQAWAPHHDAARELAQDLVHPA
jgi:hypothetical protein